MKPTTRRTLLVLILAIFLMAPLVSVQGATAQRRFVSNRKQGRNRYNPSTETTVTGTVQQTLRKLNRRGKESEHLLIKTSTETLKVHVGPARFLDQNGFTLAQGDQVEVVGSRVQHRRSDVLIAREIRKSGKVLTLRDATGKAVWSKRGRRF